jgi:hypothetical protein
MTSYIYFIQAQDAGPIKIGSTGDNPRKRMVKIQSDCPWPVKLLGAIEGTVSQEKQIHLVLSRYKTQGEWFEADPVVLAAVATALECGVPAAFDEPVIEIDEAAHPLRKWREERKLTQTAAGKLLGTSHVCFSRWERGAYMPHRRFWDVIERKTGIGAGLIANHLCDQMAGAAQ